MSFQLSQIDELIPGSKYFTWREALTLPSLPGIALPTAEQQKKIIEQAKALDKIREYFGRPMMIHCWLRPKIYNKAVGGATNSRHLIGDATDFHIQGISIEEAKKEIISKKLYPGRGEYDTTTWIHLDLSGVQWFYGRVQPV